MKKSQQFYTLIVLAVLIVGSCKNKSNEIVYYAKQSNRSMPNAIEQGCDSYYPLNKGIVYELTYYDKKDKVNTIVKNKIVESKNIDNGVEATCKMIFTDQKGNSSIEMTYKAKCQDDKYYLNLESMFSQLTSQYKAQGMDISIENGIAIIPNNLAVGDKLEDIAMSMKMSSNVFNTNVVVTILDRNVVGEETKTTPAGTFDCMILSQNTITKMGDIMTVKTSSKEWISKGVGIVRSENYNKKGELEGYTLLTKFSK